jgi:hydrogenase maturation protease
MTDARRRTLVIGLGNPLMGDDGIGLAALEQLNGSRQLPGGVELVDGGTWGMNLLPLIESADTVILLDAIRLGRPAGTVIELEGDAVPRRLAHKLSPHQIDLGEVLALAALRGTLPPRLYAIGLEPAVVEMRTSLSPVVAAALPLLLARVVDRLELLGHRPEGRRRRRAEPAIRPCTS